MYCCMSSVCLGLACMYLYDLHVTFVLYCIFVIGASKVQSTI